MVLLLLHNLCFGGGDRGWGYFAFLKSDGNEDTIEKRLFHALTTTKLVEYIATGENYSRCGRTDRGVSALGNVSFSTEKMFESWCGDHGVTVG